jgi:predicted hydrolase (HD superfamily)
VLREEVLNSVKANVENENLIKHRLATEAIMRALARRLGDDEWVGGIGVFSHL